MTEELDQETLDALHQVFDMAREGNVDGLRDLLDGGLNVNLTNSKGDTLLILAAYSTQIEVVQLLIEHGADIERANDHGQTALGTAVFRQSAEIVKALRVAGANPDGGAQSARNIANFFNLPEMTELLNA